ncbi:SCP2 domain-containing protein [Aliivibrio sp. EL58]|jgi:ubiquinone biosynthesis protein UbiJ|uniref:ubiquinone biosynthesis accessory factor UbiJ n=1 Tax=Aliivibrio sp. EL58 TaxID=2107582 RepID=UPI000EFC2933|nr:SCP2 domain-containing protein [Aliivibrio sp. EL58]
MPLEPFVTGVMETGLNTLLKESPDSKVALLRLKGKIIHVHLNEVNKDLFFVFSHLQVDILSKFEGQADCYLALNLSVLPQLRDQNNITQLIKQDKLVLEGDLKLAQQFSGLLEELKPDVEEKLSQYTGDIVAHTLVSSVKGSACWVKKQITRQTRHAAEVLTEEWKIAPAPLEIAHFCDQVSDVETQLSELDARLTRLLTNNPMERA